MENMPENLCSFLGLHCCRRSSDFDSVSYCTPQLVWVLSSLLEKTVAYNEQQCLRGETALLSDTPPYNRSCSVFQCLQRPPISICKYLERISLYANCSPSCFVVALIYLHRFSLPLTSLNVHRLLITTIMLSAKFLDDICYDNAYYAKVGGIKSIKEMNRLEAVFLFGLGFRLHVSTSLFQKYCLHLEREASLSTAARHIQRISFVNCDGWEDGHSHKQRCKNHNCTPDCNGLMIIRHQQEL